MVIVDLYYLYLRVLVENVCTKFNARALEDPQVRKIHLLCLQMAPKLGHKFERAKDWVVNRVGVRGGCEHEP